MVRELLASAALYDLPLIAFALFAAIFGTVLIRVCQKHRLPEYRRMAALPLDDDTVTGDDQ